MLSLLKKISNRNNDVVDENVVDENVVDENVVDENVPKLINQGTYGCIFRPGIECSGKQLTSTKYITKVQKNRETANHEVEIGKKIKEMSNYNQYSKYYAPILESCDVTVRELKSSSEAKKCDFLKNADEIMDKPFESNRIRYVGENTLGEYLVQETTNINQIESYYRKQINMNLTILTGISKLNNENIMHFDMKENNIMCKNKSGRPVIIDFGLSVDTTNIKREDFDTSSVFFSFIDNYVPWCLDITIITYMVNMPTNALINTKKKNTWREEKASVDEIKKVIIDFAENNPVMNDLFTKDDKDKYIADMNAYYVPLVEGGMMNVPLWGSIYDEIIKYHKSWDNYGTAVMFLYLLKDMKLLETSVKIPFMKQYVNILKSQVLSVPNKRETAEETIITIKEAISNIPRKEKQNVGKILTPEFRNPQNIKDRIKAQSARKADSAKKSILLNQTKYKKQKKGQ